MSATWSEVPLDKMDVPDWGFHRPDETMLLKLAESLTHHGQVQALVTCEAGGKHLVLDGRLVLAAMRRLGWTHAHVRCLGPLSRHQAMRVALSMETAATTDYARLAAVVGELAGTYEDTATAAAALSRTTPFTPSQLAHYVTLLSFDWKQFAEIPDAQAGLDWGEEPEPDAPAPVASPAVEALLADEIVLDNIAAALEADLPTWDGPEPEVELPLFGND